MARYVLLRIEDDDQAADLIADMAVYPDADLLTPSQEHQVHATVVDLPSLWRTADRSAYAVSASVADEIGRSHAAFLAAPAAYAREN